MNRELKEELYKIFDKIIINFKASEESKISWFERDEMNKKIADNFIDKLYEQNCN